MSQVTRRRPAASPLTAPAVQGAERRVRWLKWLVLALSALAVAIMVSGSLKLASTWAHETPVRHIYIVSSAHKVDLPELQAALDGAVRGNFFTANLDELRAVALRFPWVADVSISRRWPDSMLVAVTEKQAVARWGDDGLVSQQGEVFRPRLNKAMTELPRLDGPRAQAQFVWEQYQAMDTILRRVGLHIVNLELTPRMSWVLHLEGGVQILVDSQDSIAKLERFTVLYDRQLASDIGSIARIDLRYRNGVAIGWRQG